MTLKAQCRYWGTSAPFAWLLSSAHGHSIFGLLIYLMSQEAPVAGFGTQVTLYHAPSAVRPCVTEMSLLHTHTECMEMHYTKVTTRALRFSCHPCLSGAMPAPPKLWDRQYPLSEHWGPNLSLPYEVLNSVEIVWLPSAGSLSLLLVCLPCMKFRLHVASSLEPLRKMMAVSWKSWCSIPETAIPWRVLETRNEKQGWLLLLSLLENSFMWQLLIYFALHADFSKAFFSESYPES